MSFNIKLPVTLGLFAITAAACSQSPSETTTSPETNIEANAEVNTETNAELSAKLVMPSEVIDLTHWTITIPLDLDGNDKADTINNPEILKYSHANFFYVNENNEVVFTSPNKAITTPNSSNTRSELRQIGRGADQSIGTKEYANNFSLAAHEKASEFAAIGGRLEATLRVNHVSVNAGHSQKEPAYSAVVGQIHGVKEKSPYKNSGYGNEPLKIYYKKWPNHETGSVFWNYERNLAKEHPDRRDIAYPVWGNTWDISDDPGEQGIALNEDFSYVVNVHENVMHLTFKNDRLGQVNYQIDLSNGVDANGKLDDKDNPNGYSNDQLYFKAGIYNQCSTQDKEGFWYTACPGTGDWNKDKANGNYAQSTFSKLVLGASQAPKNLQASK